MTPTVADRVKETSTSTGTGNFTLAGAEAGFQGFSAIGSGNTTDYVIADANSWEVGVGTYTAPSTLSRDSVLGSSNSNSLVNWGAGVKEVFVSYPAAAIISTSDAATPAFTYSKLNLMGL